MFLCLLSAACTAIVPLALEILLNNIFECSNKFYIVIVLIILLLFVSILIEIYKYISLDKMGGSYILNLLERLESSLLNLDEIRLDKIDKSKISHILYSDVLDVFRTVGNYLPNIITSILISLLLFLISIYIDKNAAFFLLVADIVCIVSSYCARNKIRNRASKTNYIIKKLHLMINDFIESISFVKTNN